ncbi:MAG: hypothetical protein ACI4JM_10685 [Oscillospiraceae bacterium]
MGEINQVRCKKCGYFSKTRSGPGFSLFQEISRTKEAILNGEIENDEAFHCLKNGGKLSAVAAYLCPKCKIFTTNNQMYCLTDFTVSPYGTIHFEVIFPFGKPQCEICNSELLYIQNIRSSKVKCPKCGGELVSRLSGYYD